MAAPTIVFRGGAGSISVSFTGHAVGDLLLAVVAVDRQFGTITADNSFTVLAQPTAGAGTVAVQSALVAKIATSTTESVTVGAGTRSRANVSFVVSGHDLTTVSDLVYDFATQSSTTFNYPALTLSSTRDYLVLGVHAVGGGGTTVRPTTAPSGFSNFTAYASGTGTTDVAVSRFDGSVSGVTSVDPPNQSSTSSDNAVLWTIAVRGAVTTEAHTGSVNLSGSGTLSASGVPTVASTVPLSGSGSLSGAGSATASSAVTLSGSGTLSAVGAMAVSRSVGLSGVGTLSGVGVLGMSGAVSLSGSGTLSASGTPAMTRTVGFSGSGTLSTTRSPAVSRTVPLSGSGTLSAVGTAVVVTASVSLSGSGTLGVTGTPAFANPVALSGSGTLSATGTAIQSGQASVAFTGSGTLTTTRRPAFARTVPLGGNGTLAVVGKPGYIGQAQLTGSGMLTATGTASITKVANLTGVGVLSASGVAAMPGFHVWLKHGVITKYYVIGIRLGGETVPVYGWVKQDGELVQLR